AAFYALFGLPALVLNLVFSFQVWAEGILPFIAFLGRGAGIVAMLGTMRHRNGYRGLHEIVSGTRVVGLPWQRTRRKLRVPPYQFAMLKDVGAPVRLGSFEVYGTIAKSGDDRILLAEDAILDRRVWIHLRGATALPLPVARREINRTSRPRWLASGTYEGLHWDAFLAPAGCPLTELVKSQGRLSWADAHVLLEQLTDELA